MYIDTNVYNIGYITYTTVTNKMEKYEMDDIENSNQDDCTWDLEENVESHSLTAPCENNEDAVNDPIHVVRELFLRYASDPYMTTRTYNYICYQLPNILDNIQKDHEYRMQRMEELSNEQQQFIQSFMSNNQYFYVHNVERFFHYDGIHYKILSEDDILYHRFHGSNGTCCNQFLFVGCI